MTVVELAWQPHALDLAEGLEEGPDLLGGGLKGDIAHHNLGGLGVLVLVFASFLGGRRRCDVLLHAQLQVQLVTTQHGALQDGPYFEQCDHHIQKVAHADGRSGAYERQWLRLSSGEHADSHHQVTASHHEETERAFHDEGQDFGDYVLHDH